MKESNMEELRDRNGLTEKEFLSKYDASKYEHPSVTVDIILLKDNRVMLIKRGGHPCIGKLAFPGGFVEMNEDVYTAAKRELYEETKLEVKSLRQLRVASTPNRDPRTRIITVPFLADVEDAEAFCAGDDAMAAKWYNYSYKKLEMGGTTLFEINIATENGRETFKVSKNFDKSGLSADPIYKSIGINPLAGDHAELMAMAIDETEKEQ
jgi:ADP-ribose pyrophosphatase YjhB (NUDIX family)